MSKGISLHIGLNRISPAHYENDGKLKGCISDANAMLEIAKANGFSDSTILINEEGTFANVTQHIKNAAKQLAKGDMFFISYSGHGGQVWDENKDEKDMYDETWCLYDRMIIDDELAALWAKFKSGVRILMVSDSCHSGSMNREKMKELKPGSKFFPNANEVVRKNAAVYSGTIQSKAKSPAYKASLMLLSGCKDNQESTDGGKNGIFTKYLLKYYNKGKFAGNYKSLIAVLNDKIPADYEQNPCYSLEGVADKAFESSLPFRL